MDQAAPSYHSAASSHPSVPAYTFPSDSSFSQQVASYPDSSNLYPSSSFPDHSSNPSPYSNMYTTSYAPVVPSYPAAGSPYDRSYEIGVGLSPPSTSFDSSVPQQPSHYGIAGYGAAPQAPTGYDSYDKGKGGYPSQSEQAYSGASYDQGSTLYGRSDMGHYGNGGGSDRSYANGGFLDVHAYDGGGVEPYGARGTGSNSWAIGASRNLGSSDLSSDILGSNSKITRATPKVDGDADSAGGVQKFRVTLLPEMRSTDSSKDVVCQIGLDGVRMVDPNTSITLRIYPLDTITKWEVKEPSVFTFWAKSAVDVDQRIIKLKSSNYTTRAILDTLTAACVQLCEMVGKDGPSDGSNSTGGAGTSADTVALKKGSVLDWVALRPRAATAEEKQHWVPDEAVTKCTNCDTDFGAFLRRHHCRNCGDIFCDKCTRGRIALTIDEDSQPVRVCDRCLAEVTHRLENMTKPKISAPQRTHEDLAKKLQEELERNQAARKQVSVRPSSGHGGSGQTSVLNCTKCGAITLVTGNSSRCSNCGADPGNTSSVSEKASDSFSSSARLQGPPHLWSSNVPVADGPVPQMREVACPTCTVHLQVQVPRYGTETVECGVCQHPFLVNA